MLSCVVRSQNPNWSTDKTSYDYHWSGDWSIAVEGAREAQKVSERVVLRHFILKMIMLPRQARDKRRESTQKESGVFS